MPTKSALQAAVGAIPSQLTAPFQDTVIEDMYHRINHRFLTIDTVTAESPCGAFQYTAPSNTFGGAFVINEIRNSGVHEHVLTAELCDELGENSVFYDVGSHYGYFIDLAKAAGVKESQIYGFEAERKRDLFLSDEYPNIQTTHGFVGDGTGKTISLDEFANSNPAPTIVKIDVEGAEYGVLSGMKRIMRTAHPTIFVEIHPSKMAKQDGTVSDVIELLRNADYTLHTANHRDSGTNWAEVNDKNFADNFLLRAST